MEKREHHEVFAIADAHPTLPGHFPRQPLVPGVVLLDRVIATAEREWGRQARAIPMAKFLRPLLPGKSADLHLKRQATTIEFRITQDGEVIANGQIGVSQ